MARGGCRGSGAPAMATADAALREGVGPLEELLRRSQGARFLDENVELVHDSDKGRYLRAKRGESTHILHLVHSRPGMSPKPVPTMSPLRIESVLVTGHVIGC